MSEKGIVYLVGAGAGDKGLLTLKGLECIQKADVIIYDKLASSSLLNFAKPECELIFAGKEAGLHHLKQSETNKLLVDKAKQGKIVVRLKGGDPFIFGRGGEEAEILANENIKFEIVCGVSSCYSAGAYAGIPITHRDYASSFHVITGHENVEKQTLAIDFKVLAKEEGTLIFMMCLKSLPKIVKQLIENGKNPKTPVAIIQQGTTSNQLCVMSTLENICDETVKAGIKTPALTIIGDVVKLREKIAWFENEKPLFGENVMLTGTKNINADIAKGLDNLGCDTTEISLIKTTPINQQQFEGLEFKDYTWIVFSSGTGVDIFFDWYIKSNNDIRKLANIKFATVGEKTALQLKKYGINVDCLPEKYESKYLAEKLVKQLTSKDNVLLLRAETASDVLQKSFEQNNIKYTELPIYKTEINFNKKSVLTVSANAMDYIVFASSSAVEAYTKLLDNYKDVNTKYIAIGNITAKTAEKAGLKIHSIAETSTADGIVQCILNCSSDER